jgi:RimJ/RimL family protein N-acetyltransferase
MRQIETPRLVIRNWEGRDREVFHEINSDPIVMEFFPRRRNRQESDALMDLLVREISKDGYGFAALELKETGETIGFAGLSEPELEPLLPTGTIEIGWRLVHRHWGKGLASEAARALLDFGFGELGLGEIVAFAVENNHRSTAVMRRIGMRPDPARDFDHPRIPDDMPHLKRHVLYRIGSSDRR